MNEAIAGRRTRLEREFGCRPEALWQLWTTPEGIESWWGPEGFEVTVRSLELREGGELHYAMAATAPDQIEFLSRAGMPAVSEHRLTYTAVVNQRRLAFQHLVDFVPGAEPYTVAIEAQFEAIPAGVRLRLDLDLMHDEHWSQLMVRGWEGQLGRLAGRLAG